MKFNPKNKPRRRGASFRRRAFDMKETFYFRHDYNARNDPKLQDVLIDLGVAGIGIYWCIVEQLYEQGGYLPMRQCKCIAFALHVQCEVVENLVKNYNLFDNDGVRFWSPSVLNRLDERKRICESRRKSAAARWSKTIDNERVSSNGQRKPATDENASALQMQSESIANESYKGNNNKENIKESIKKSGTRFSPPTVEEVKAYVLEKGYTDVDPERFVAFYESKGWFVGKNKMKSWKAAVVTWHRGRNNYNPGAYRNGYRANNDY